MDKLMGNETKEQTPLDESLEPLRSRLEAYRGWITGPLYDRYRWQPEPRNRVVRPMADAEPSLPKAIDARVDPVYYSECQDG